MSKEKRSTVISKVAKAVSKVPFKDMVEEAVAKMPKPKPKVIVFDGKLLAKDILDKRIKDNLSFRAIYAETGLHPSQLQNVEACNTAPSADKFAAIITWLSVDANRYFVTKK